MAKARSLSQVEDLTADLNETKSDAQAVLEEAETDISYSREVMDDLEEERAKRHKEVDADIDSSKVKHEQIEQQAQRARRKARVLSDNMKFMLGEINILQLLWRTLV